MYPSEMLAPTLLRMDTVGGMRQVLVCLLLFVLIYVNSEKLCLFNRWRWSFAIAGPIGILILLALNIKSSCSNFLPSFLFGDGILLDWPDSWDYKHMALSPQLSANQNY